MDQTAWDLAENGPATRQERARELLGGLRGREDAAAAGNLARLNLILTDLRAYLHDVVTQR